MSSIHPLNYWMHSKWMRTISFCYLTWKIKHFEVKKRKIERVRHCDVFVRQKTDFILANIERESPNFIAGRRRWNRWTILKTNGMNYIYTERKRERKIIIKQRRNRKQTTAMLMSSKNSANQKAARERTAVGRKWTDKAASLSRRYFLQFLFSPAAEETTAAENIHRYYIKYSRGNFHSPPHHKNGRC